MVVNRNTKSDLKDEKLHKIRKCDVANDISGAWARLAAAIVEQAAKDANGYRRFNAFSQVANRNCQKNEVKRFFCDDNSIFPLCMPNTDGKTLYKIIMRNYEIYGNYMPPQDDTVKKGGGILI